MTKLEMRYVYGLIAILCLLASCSYCNSYLGLKNDHVVEQTAEAIIKAEYGVDVDLTPE